VNAVHLDERARLWVVDAGTPAFGGNPVDRGAKVVCIDLKTETVPRIFHLGADIAKPGSYVDDIRIHGSHAYLTDAGNPGIIVLDLEDGSARRVLDNHPSTVAPADRPIVVDGETVFTPDGSLLRVHSDPLELSPDGIWLCYGPLEGPWSRIETRFLDDATLFADELASKVEPWADLPPIGGCAMDPLGRLYFTDLAECALKRRDTDGSIHTIVVDRDLHWVDAPFIDDSNVIWLPVPQLDRAALFHGGRSEIQWPIRLYRLALSGNARNHGRGLE
jgi:hypothetical protein